jgi:hypothetical protein
MGMVDLSEARISFEKCRNLANTEGILYRFHTERGFNEADYAGYLGDRWLRNAIGDKERYRLVAGRTIFSYTREYLSKHPRTLSLLAGLEAEIKANPVRFFAPSGRAAAEFLNDEENDLSILVACNRFGKTQTMLIKKIINSIPCDPKWEIFTEHGVKYRPWRGAVTVGLASYDFSFHRDTALSMLLDWLPERELGPYAKTYVGKGAKQVNLGNSPVLPLACGTRYVFAAMSQGQVPFEGNVKHEWGWDEQGAESAFDGADERTRTVPGGRHDFALTPHKVEGRPDTGAGSWISKLCEGRQSKGRRVSMHVGEVWDVPDWIYPEDAKLQAYVKWVAEPEALQDEKARREGMARFFGKWHEASGLVIDEWDSSKHVIEPFKIPPDWTLYRALDHGDKHPAACLWAAASPGGDIFIYRDYLKTGRVPTQVALEVLEASGNRRVKVGTYRNPKTSSMYDRYEEVFAREHIQWTVFDARAFSTHSAGEGVKLSKLYDMAGLKVKQGSGKDSDHYVPILKEWFRIDYSKPHYITKEPGAPRVYVFNTCVDFIRTIKRWVWVERKTKSTERLAKESPTKKDDDLCDCLKLLIQAGPRYMGNPMSVGYPGQEEGLDYGGANVVVSRPVDPITGY